MKSTLKIRKVKTGLRLAIIELYEMMNKKQQNEIVDKVFIAKSPILAHIIHSRNTITTQTCVS